MIKSSVVSAIAIAQNDLLCYAKNRMAIFWTFLGPALCMWLFGFLTPSASNLTPVWIVGAASHSLLATTLTSALRSNGHLVTETDKAPANGLSIELQSANSTLPVVIHAGQKEDEAERSLRYEIDAQLSSFARDSSSNNEKSSITVDAVSAPPAINGFQRTVPAYLIMFLTMNLLVSGAAFSEERASGRVRRLLTAPVPALSVIVGRLASRLVVAWLQMLVLFSIGVFLLHIHWAEHTLSLISILSLYVLAMGSIGIVIGTFFRDPDQASALAMWGALVLAPFAGLWWPIELMPTALQHLANWLPTGWVMHSVTAMLSSDTGIADFRLTSVGLICVAVVAVWISARRLVTGSKTA